MGMMKKLEKEWIGGVERVWRGRLGLCDRLFL